MVGGWYGEYGIDSLTKGGGRAGRGKGRGGEGGREEEERKEEWGREEEQGKGGWAEMVLFWTPLFQQILSVTM